ncbi:SMI1/KNR4 family protein [Microbacterium sp. NPDC078428]|uniref:SMI1/KNR4 family protein n=1 Tax=Microbacterium sp. NPDC078428 TaxID=3364190 RepID=UPI0037C53620
MELTANTPAAEFHDPPQFLANTDPDQVDNRFTRADARDFYTRHNPVEVVVESIWQDITFYPFADLDDQQIGYATDSRTGEAVADWPPNMLVIADSGGDPIMMDPSVNGEVFFAIHGTGSWDPQPIAKDISGLLTLSIAWLEMSEQRGDELYDEPDDLHPASIALFRDLAAAQGVENRHIQNVISLR